MDDYKGTLIFDLANGSYIGLIVLFLAGIGAYSLLKQRSLANVYFAALAVGWILFAYNILNLGRVLSRLPGLSVAHATRSGAVWTFSLAVLAAAGVDWLRDKAQRDGASDLRSALHRLAPLLVGAASLAAVAYAFQRDLRASQHVAGAAANAADRVARQSLVWIGVTFAAGVVVLSLIALTRRPRFSRLALAALAMLVFAQSGLYLRDFNPTIQDRYFYPQTQLLADLKATTHNELLLGLGTTSIPPEVNVWYRMRSPFEYDALGVRDYEVVARRMLGYPTKLIVGDEQIGGFLGEIPLAPSNPLDVAALRTMGVRWVTTGRDYPWGTLRSSQPLPKETARWRALDTARSVHARLTGQDLRGNLVTIRTRGVSAGDMCELVIRTAPAATDGVGRISQPCREGITTFPVSKARNGGRDLNLAFSGPDHVSIGVDPSGHPIAGLWETRVIGLVSVWDRQGVRLFSVPGAVDRFFSPARAERVSSENETLTRLAASDFDASQVVLLLTSEDVAASPARATEGQVRVVGESADHIHLQVTRDQPGWVVGMQSYFPGWQAKVNGIPTSIIRANYAFQAIQVPGGTSDVELVYRPASVRHGIIISAMSAVGFLTALAWVLMVRRRRTRS